MKIIKQNEETVRYMQFLKELKITRLGLFAELIGVTPFALYNLKLKYNNLSLDVLKKTYFKHRNLNLDWLLFGEGEIFRTAKLRLTAESIAKEITTYQAQTKEELQKMKDNLMTAMQQEAEQLQKEARFASHELDKLKKAQKKDTQSE